jgi:hypothetical protein
MFNGFKWFKTFNRFAPFKSFKPFSDFNLEPPACGLALTAIHYSHIVRGR